MLRIPHINIKGYLKRFNYCDDETINIIGFLVINFSFSLVEFIYGKNVNSVGLISDAFHMFFDCTALIIGLFASLLKNIPPNSTYTYGYGRADAMCGIINGIILVFTSFFLMRESWNRLTNPPIIEENYLLFISFLGFLVNVIGIVIFHHGGQQFTHCSQHDDDAKNDAKNNAFNEQSPNGIIHSSCVDDGHETHILLPTKTHLDHVANCANNHQHQHQTNISHGILLHIIADTLGSLGVIVSSYFVSNYGIMWADPLCCGFISLIIIVGSYDLLRSCIRILMQGISNEMVRSSGDALRLISKSNPTVRIAKSNFWSLSKNKHLATLHIHTPTDCDYNSLLNSVNKILVDAGFTETTVQIMQI